MESKKLPDHIMLALGRDNGGDDAPEHRNSGKNMCKTKTQS